MKRVAPLIIWRRRHGSTALHLAAHLLVFAIAAFALARIVSGGGGTLKAVIAWYLGLIVLHDLVLVPAYTGVDRVTRAVLARLPTPERARVPVINHLRVPALISAVLLLIYAPLISGHAEASYVAVTGHPLVHYLRNWLLVSAALFAGSAVIYVVRMGVAARTNRSRAGDLRGSS